jgi:hypothetical protein
MPASLTFVKGKKKEIIEAPGQFGARSAQYLKFQKSLRPKATVVNMAFLVSPLMWRPTGKFVAPSGTPVGWNPEREPRPRPGPESMGRSDGLNRKTKIESCVFRVKVP